MFDGRSKKSSAAWRLIRFRRLQEAPNADSVAVKPF